MQMLEHVVVWIPSYLHLGAIAYSNSTMVILGSATYKLFGLTPDTRVEDVLTPDTRIEDG